MKMHIQLGISERDYLGDTDADGRMILKWILQKKDMRVWIGFIWLRVVTSDGFL
jgi:hypothetical protein